MPPLAALRERLQDGAQPLAIFNKSHSGSRLLTRIVETAGLFMGAHQNESSDSLDLAELVTALVVGYYPDYEKHWQALLQDGRLAALAEQAFQSHLEGYDRQSSRPWGWKLSETAYAGPVIGYLFPRAKFIHLIRDGRDVAFCDHIGPDNAFWRKIYFNTERLTWKSLWLNRRLYPLRSHVYNAVHWANSVRVGREFAARLGDRCLEVRYEDLCQRFAPTLDRILRFIGTGDRREIVRRIQPIVYTSSIGKYDRMPARQQRAVLRITGPILSSLGYLPPGDESSRSSGPAALA